MDTNIELEQFRYFNIQADIDSICGNWAVSVEGDVVNCLYPYAILSFLFYDVDWKEITRTKVWFKHECEEFLNRLLQSRNYQEWHIEKDIPVGRIL